LSSEKKSCFFIVVFDVLFVYNGVPTEVNLMKAYVVLSGQTDLDAQGRLTGKNDPPLNDTGKAQAEELAQGLQSKGIDMILASPHIRTMETAEIIADVLGFDKSKITKGLKLVGRDFGEFNDKPISEIDMFALSSWFRNAATPGGETIKDTGNRVISYMNNMVKIFRTKTMLLVIPGQIFKVMYWFFNGLPEQGKEHVIDADNCNIYEFETDDIPQEIKDYDSAAIPEPADTSNDPGRLLSQSEIDALFAELAGG